MDPTLINWAMNKASSAPSVLHGCDLSQLFRVDGHITTKPSSYQVGFIIPLNHNHVLMLVRYQSITMQHSSSATPIQRASRAAVYNQPQHLGHTAKLWWPPPVICTTVQALVFELR